MVLSIVFSFKCASRSLGKWWWSPIWRRHETRIFFQMGWLFTNHQLPTEFLLSMKTFHWVIEIFLRSTPHPVTVTTRIISFLVGNPYKPSFATVTGWGVDPKYSKHSGKIPPSHPATTQEHPKDVAWAAYGRDASLVQGTFQNSWKDRWYGWISVLASKVSVGFF